MHLISDLIEHFLMALDSIEVSFKHMIGIAFHLEARPKTLGTLVSLLLIAVHGKDSMKGSHRFR